MSLLVVKMALPAHVFRFAAAEMKTYYDVLQVQKTASPPQIKAAYRKLALQHHPDVSSSSDAHDEFIELSRAYEVLIDKGTRSKYDIHGEAGLKGWVSKGDGATSDVWSTWDEFKPIQRKTRRGDARTSSGSKKGPAITDDGNEFPGGATQAQLGDVVEYFLSDAAKALHQDGRLKGVGLVVGRNIDRQDRDKLPVECLDLVEIEPLYQESNGDLWRADPMESPAFTSLPTLRILQVDYERVQDSWRILDDLSSDCGSPIYAEEIIL